MRIQYKGGVWKNSEDEILKAAVMKYGMNQWARIASLLVRKSSKQCKARWFEWLDPAIKKTEWTRGEEEKLLHLVKIMPTQWRTIAPMIGRTAAQCIEHYERLVDQAQDGTQKGEKGSGAGPSTAVTALGRQRPGDIDSVPETRPARPDPVDMDEDELEMLSEARARLANTKGKKAKRKAREQQLEAAKRLAQLQKRRELKATGIAARPPRNKRKVTDYGTEIPFERPAVPGFYETVEEDEIAARQMSQKDQIGKLLQKYRGKTEKEKEEEARKEDNAKRKELLKQNLPAALGLDTPNVPRSPPLKKARFALPAPQLTDKELGNISKSRENILQERGTAREVPGSKGMHVTNGTRPPRPTANFTDSVTSAPQGQKAEPWSAVRQRHLETIMSLKTAEAPLRGGENTPVPELGLDGRVTPAHIDLRTPNPLAVPSFMTNASLQATNGDQKKKRKRKGLTPLQQKIKKALDSLPEPENEYELSLDNIIKGNKEDDVKGRNGDFVEDAEDEARRIRQEGEQFLTDERKALMSSAAKRDLPLPLRLASSDPDPHSVEFLVQRDLEVTDVLKKADSSREVLPKFVQALKEIGDRDIYSRKDIRRANQLIELHQKAEVGDYETFIGIVMEALTEAERNQTSDSSEPQSKPGSEVKHTLDGPIGNGAMFVHERAQRIEQLTEIYKCHGTKIPDRTDDINRLRKKLDLDGEDRIYWEARKADDKESIMKLLDGLRSKVRDFVVPRELATSLSSDGS